MPLTRVYLIAVTVAAIALFGSYLALYRYQFGAPIPASYDVKNWLLLKERIAANTQGHKILLVADSNVLFGFDSAYAESKLGRPVVNMGLHGAFPLDWILSVAERNAKPGDIVVFPLVWDYYLKDYRIPHAWNLDQIIAWDSEYLESLPLSRRIKYFTSQSPLKMAQNVDVQLNRDAVLKANPLRQLLPRDEALAYYDQVSGMQSTFSYSYVNINTHGDIRHTCGQIAKATGADFTKPGAKVSQEAMKRLVETVNRLRERGVESYVTASVVVDDETTRAPGFQKILNDVWAELKINDVPVLGSPTDYFFPPNAFFDTSFHLNCDATHARTEIFVKTLSERLRLNVRLF
jgi:enamine deaminase RidA (YjgF/YER057c/UK114 family)